VAPGSSCTATITYYPTNSGSDSGTFTVTSTAPNSPHVVSLSTTAVSGSSTTAGVAPSTSSLAFTSAARTKTVLFTNNTSKTVTFIQASMTSARFGQSNNCGEVAPGKSCTATVTYYPTNSGSDSGTFTVTSTAPNSPHQVALAASGSTTTSAGLANPTARGVTPVVWFSGREDRR